MWPPSTVQAGAWLALACTVEGMCHLMPGDLLFEELLRLFGALLLLLTHLLEKSDQFLITFGLSIFEVGRIRLFSIQRMMERTYQVIVDVIQDG